MDEAAIAEPSGVTQDEDMATEQRVSDSGLDGAGPMTREASLVSPFSPANAQPDSTVIEDMEDWGSSFSDTGSDEDLPLDPLPIPPVMTGRVPAVRDGHWREYRRELNWRCRWVELRMHELREQERRYAALERKLLAEGGALAGAVEQAEVRGSTASPLASLLRPPAQPAVDTPAHL